jgi:hypothetical protein
MIVTRKQHADLYASVYPMATKGDSPTDYLENRGGYHPCASCGTPTSWFDLQLGKYTCSITCRNSLLEASDVSSHL